MKPSHYNIIFSEDGNTYFYNGITRTYFRTSQNVGEKIEVLLDTDISAINKLSASLYKVLEDGNFILPSEMDELQIVKAMYSHDVECDSYSLIILPTMNCNLACPYCVQDHKISVLRPEVMENIKKHLVYMVEKEKVKSLNIEWFGGEPFLYFEEVIQPLSEFAKELCCRNDIPFYSSATTNGTLISEEVAGKIPAYNFMNFQITIDGDRNLHNTIKFSDELNSAFDTTLGNIVSIIKANPLVQILLRINYTARTLDSDIVKDVCGLIPPEVRQNIKVMLKKVWQIDVDSDRYGKYQELLSNFRKNGFEVERLDIATNHYPCYVNRIYYNCINYDGKCYKCTNCDDFYKETGPGEIAKDGKIVWKDNYDRKNTIMTYDNPICLACKLLPICYGNCPKDHMHSKEFVCRLDGSDVDIRQGIKSLVDDAYDLGKTGCQS